MHNLKSLIEEKLKKAEVIYQFILLPENLPTDIKAHVKFHGIEMKDAVPTLIYKTENGLIAVQRRADTQLDIKKLKELVGVKQLNFANDRDLEFLGVEPGYVPLTGLAIPFYVDNKLLELKKVYGGGGDRLFALTISTSDLIRVNNAKVGNFSSEEINKGLIKSGRKRILSGITPSGDGTLHIGNYLGAVKQFVEFARHGECFLMVADLHALTTIQEKETLQKNTETLIINELALLGDLSNIVFFRQSDVLQHAELTWILNNVTPLGLLRRAHAYKDKLSKDVLEDEINLGLFNYPILMAADILLYKPDFVPVGKDQKQHVEICRDIAGRLNKTYRSNVLKLPQPFIPEDVAVVMGTDGKRKMSKSLGNIISIFDDEKIIRKQVMSTYTDPTRIHANDPGHIEGNMVFNYLDFFGDTTSSRLPSGLRVASKVEELKKLYMQGKVADVEVKNYLFESLIITFAKARERYKELKANPQMVKKILQDGADKARAVAGQTMMEIREVIGLTNSYSFFRY